MNSKKILTLNFNTLNETYGVNLHQLLLREHDISNDDEWMKYTVKDFLVPLTLSEIQRLNFINKMAGKFCKYIFHFY